jgi:phage-related minor tail protein
MENTRALFSMAGKAPPAAEEGDTEEAFASGGIVRGPTRALMGEAGPEAILPLTRRNGKLGVSLHGINGGGGGYVINIDARGAAPGVEHRIRAAIRESEDRVTRGVLRSISSQRRRSV